MIERPIRTERQEAMLFAIAIWHAETKNRSESFDLRNVQIGHQPIFGAFLKAAAPRYARLPPGVPFVLAEA